LRDAVTHAAHAGTASGLNDVLIAAAAFAAVGAIAGFAFGPDPARRPPPSTWPSDRPSSKQPAAAHEVIAFDNTGVGGSSGLTPGTVAQMACDALDFIQMPAFVANGDTDPMIKPRYSHLLAGLRPDPHMKIYPHAGPRVLIPNTTSSLQRMWLHFLPRKGRRQ
jgi:hypothetical protein